MRAHFLCGWKINGLVAGELKSGRKTSTSIAVATQTATCFIHHREKSRLCSREDVNASKTLQNFAVKSLVEESLDLEAQLAGRHRSAFLSDPLAFHNQQQSCGSRHCLCHWCISLFQQFSPYQHTLYHHNKQESTSISFSEELLAPPHNKHAASTRNYAVPWAAATQTQITKHNARRRQQLPQRRAQQPEVTGLKSSPQ